MFGGVFLGTGITGNIFNPQSLPAGLYNITYLISNAFGCSAQLTRQVNVLNPPTLSLGNVPTLCSNGTQLLLTVGSPSGGIYSGTGIVSGGFFNPAISGPGNFAIVYTIANAGCTTRDTFNITVNQAPIATISIRTDSLVAPVFGGSYQWFIGNDSIIGATDSIYIPTQDGLYSVRLRDDSTLCTAFSPQVNYIVGGSPLFSDLENHIKIYPNPTSGQVSIEAIQEGILEIYTAEGRSVGIYRLLPGLNTILLSKVSAGFYTLIIREDPNNSIKRGRLTVISSLE